MFDDAFPQIKINATTSPPPKKKEDIYNLAPHPSVPEQTSYKSSLQRVLMNKMFILPLWKALFVHGSNHIPYISSLSTIEGIATVCFSIGLDEFVLCNLPVVTKRRNKLQPPKTT